MSFSVGFDRSLSFRVFHYHPQGVTNILSLFQNAKKLRMGKINVTVGRWPISNVHLTKSKSKHKLKLYVNLKNICKVLYRSAEHEDFIT